MIHKLEMPKVRYLFKDMLYLVEDCPKYAINKDIEQVRRKNSLEMTLLVRHAGFMYDVSKKKYIYNLVIQTR